MAIHARRHVPSRPWRSRRPSAALLLLLLLLVGACASNQDDVCESVGNCAQGGSSDWIQSCKDGAALLRREATTNGCAGQFDAYYACADSSFDCQGATPVFPGCDTKRAALDDCFAAATASTSCAQLAAATSSCGDAGPPRVPEACTAARDCNARCFLDRVSNACAPRVDELSNFATCASRCP